MRNINQFRKSGETTEQFRSRRARGVCVNIQGWIQEERELFSLSKGYGDRSSIRARWEKYRAQYFDRLALAKPLP
ncbi:hypothetical protein [Pseudomonas taiwanensis]|uniref:hypothetical protein n=1 Tax=Pseudomonas taiwanensis TaxID=470150 RepID=UPI0016444BC3|nr:hypothetical protein [Pseudomonas taiwanensis]MBC3493595.1 hypothetical protein [Pseudomonas taiwanensis]